MTELPAELLATLRDLEDRAARGQRPDRLDARALLVELGHHLRDHPAPMEGVELIRTVLEGLGDAWLAAAGEELALACSEYIRSVDPRFLGLANYDFDYTLDARERLEARLTAARALGIETSVLLVREVERADILLAEALERAETPPRPEGGSGRRN